MNIKEFERNYIGHYLLLEADFRATFDFVSIEEDNYKTYSNAYLKQILAIGSEIGIMKKLIAKLYDNSFDEKNGKVNQIIQTNFPNIKLLEVKLRRDDKIFMPWNYEKDPDWWTAYNEIKHHRLENTIACRKDEDGDGSADANWDSTKKWYQYANLENVLFSLAALFTLELIAYRLIAIQEKTELFVPPIKSLFCINNSYWKDIQHVNGMTFLNGNIHLGDE